MSIGDKLETKLSATTGVNVIAPRLFNIWLPLFLINLRARLGIASPCRQDIQSRHMLVADLIFREFPLNFQLLTFELSMFSRTIVRKLPFLSEGNREHSVSFVLSVQL